MAYQKIGAEVIQCQYCKEKKKASGMRAHIRLKHPEYAQGEQPSAYSLMKAELSDWKAKYAALEAKKEAPVSVASEPAPVDRIAVLSDWIGGLTQDAWQEIGKQRGFVVEPPPTDPLPAVAAVSDVTSSVEVKPEEVVTHPKAIYMADYGITVKVK
jgi:hypothetical protein